MLKYEDVKKLCKDLELIELSISTYPTWILKDKSEGVELKDGKLISFHNKAGERVYNQPSCGTIHKLLELTNNKPSVIPSSNNGVMIPDQLTKELMDKWKGLTTFERLLPFQVTPTDYIKKKKKGNRNVSYVEGNVMQTEANISFLFDWSDCTTDKIIDDEGCSVFGYVTANIDGKDVTHSAIGIDLQEYGREDKKPIFTKHELLKNAHTDMIKKALSKFGFNGDVYRGEV